MKPVGKRSCIALMLIFLGIAACGTELSAAPGSKVKASEVIALDLTEEVQHGVEIIAWGNSRGEIYLLDGDLNLVKQIKTPNKVWIKDIIQVPEGLLALVARKAKTGEDIEILIQYSIAEGREKKRWSNPEHFIWSVAATDDRAVAMTAGGILLALEPNGFEEIAEYPETSYYLPITGAEPIICAGPDLAKLGWRPGICYREGEFDWQREGGWMTVAPPFVCGDYLVEKHLRKRVGVGIGRVGVGIGISVTDIATGQPVSEYTYAATYTSALICAGTNIIYALGSAIIVRDLPNLKEVYRFDTGSKEILSIAATDRAIYFVDGKRRVRKHDFRRM